MKIIPAADDWKNEAGYDHAVELNDEDFTRLKAAHFNSLSIKKGERNLFLEAIGIIMEFASHRESGATKSEEEWGKSVLLAYRGKQGEFLANGMPNSFAEVFT